MRDNKTILVCLTALVLCVLVVVVMDYNRRTPAEEISDTISETVEEIEDEIDDHTTGR